MSRRLDDELRAFIHSSAPPPELDDVRGRLLVRLRPDPYRDPSPSAIHDVEELQRQAREQAIAVFEKRELEESRARARLWRGMLFGVLGTVLAAIIIAGIWAVAHAVAAAERSSPALHP